MELVFLGTGSAFTLDNYQSNMILEVSDDESKKHRMLIDCGGDSRHSIHDLGYSPLDIEAVYISHLHTDHIGGLEWFSFLTYFDKRYEFKPKLYVNEKLVRKLWQNCLQGGLGSIQNQIVNLDTFYDIKLLQRNAEFDFYGLKFLCIQTW